LREAISCFLEQDYANRELVILNNNRIPIVCDLPKVRVINGEMFPTLGDCRNRLLEFADGDYVRTWDDDDLYFPWAISQGVEHIGDNPAWKPTYSWSWHKRKKRITMQGNVYEASWTMRTDWVKKIGYQASSGGDEHKTLKDALAENGGIAKDKVEPSYCYTWDTGLCHISGSLNGQLSIEERTKRWMQENNDHGYEVPIKKVDLSHYWRMFSELDRNPNEAQQAML